MIPNIKPLGPNTSTFDIGLIVSRSEINRRNQTSCIRSLLLQFFWKGNVFTVHFRVESCSSVFCCSGRVHSRPHHHTKKKEKKHTHTYTSQKKSCFWASFAWSFTVFFNHAVSSLKSWDIIILNFQKMKTLISSS